MRSRLALAGILLVPVIELAVFVAVARAVGVGWSIAATLATSVLGLVIVRHEGRRSLHRLREAVRSGRPPAADTSTGALRMVGGIALTVPGFVSDLVGLLLLAPPVRLLVRGWLVRALVRQMSPDLANHVFGPRKVRVRRGEPSSGQPSGTYGATGEATWGGDPGAGAVSRGQHGPDVIEGEVIEPPPSQERRDTGS